MKTIFSSLINFMNLHHLGFATNKFEEAKDFIYKTNNVISERGPIWDPNLRANLALFEINNGYSIELVEGPIVESLIKKNINLYHFCYEVNDLNESIKLIKSAKGFVIQRPKPAILFDNRLVTFLMTPLGLIELLEK